MQCSAIAYARCTRQLSTLVPGYVCHYSRCCLFAVVSAHAKSWFVHCAGDAARGGPELCTHIFY